MFKSFRIDRLIKTSIAKAAQKTIARIIEKYGSLSGREEDITSKLEERFGSELIEEIATQFKFNKKHGLNFDVFSYRKKQEHETGADILGIVDIQVNSKRVTKIYLAQCKVGKVTNHEKNSWPQFECVSSNDILAQAEAMLSLTSDSFFFIYTEKGIFSTPAFQIRLANKSKKIKSSEVYIKKIESFYSDFFKCFIGDEVSKLGIKDNLNIREIAEDFVRVKKINVKNVIGIVVSDGTSEYGVSSRE